MAVQILMTPNSNNITHNTTLILRVNGQCAGALLHTQGTLQPNVLTLAQFSLVHITAEVFSISNQK